MKNGGAVLSELILVTLPIGNSKDITLRALETLKSEKTFYAEDTRVFKQFLESQGISYQDKFIDSYHDQSVGKVEPIVQKLQTGTTVCLVSDAGSPIISDPAYPLLKRLTEEGISIKTVPGVTSVVTALELSALPPHPFHFWGFIGRTKNERKDFYQATKAQAGTHIFFESPHRVMDSIEAFFEVFPDETLVVTRELTKNYETVYRLKASNLSSLKEIVMEKGEFVLLYHIDKQNVSLASFGDVEEMVKDYLENGGGPKKLAKIFAKILKADTKSIYDQLGRSGKS